MNGLLLESIKWKHIKDFAGFDHSVENHSKYIFSESK